MRTVIYVNIISRVKGGRLLYTCHNINEHNISIKFINDFYRFLFSLLAFKIVYFDKSVRNHNYNFFYNKGIIANFGSFKGFLIKKNQKSLHFEKLIKSWGFAFQLDIISVSAARLSYSEEFFDKIQSTNFKSLMINPKKNKNHYLMTNNQLRFFEPVFYEIDNILMNNKELIGFVGHFNISISTSLYMFASYNIPIICFDIEPNNNIVSKNKIGEVIQVDCSVGEIISKINLIKGNYKLYQQNCANFILENSWDKSSKIHENILT
ncbi:hypothetical protein OA870_04400 [Bacteroidota bacterium]|nr:hypothetical protein [Bacteroidota bacterium]